MSESLRGQKKEWKLIRKINEGDAGEIWLSESVEPKPRTGIIKRPVQRSFGSDLHRQAGQITSEGKILGVIGGLNVKVAGATMRVVQLIDSSDLEEQNSTNVFIVLERAAGYDFRFLQKIRRNPVDFGEFNAEERSFLDIFSRLEEFPELLLTRMVAGLATILEKVHNYSATIQGESYSGIVWNDVKIYHIFWDPFHATFTVIDWGNAQLLGEDYISLDRRFSPDVDFLQYCDEIGGFLSHASPSLLNILPLRNYHDNPSDAVRSVQRAAAKRAEALHNNLQRERRRESIKLETRPSLHGIDQLQELAKRIIAFGEAPNKDITERYLAQVQREALLEQKVEVFEQVSALTGSQKNPDLELLAKILRLAESSPMALGKDTLSDLLKAVEKKDWYEVFWIFRSNVHDPIQAWWQEVGKLLHERILGPETTVISPLEVLKGVSNRLSERDELAKGLRPIIDDWKESEHQSTQGLITYEKTDQIRRLIEGPYPGDWQSFNQALRQPITLASVTLDAWKGQDLERAHKVLRHWLVYDPDRLRVFTLDMLFGQASSWLNDTMEGPESAESIQSFAARMIRKGEPLTRVAHDIPWLDERLEILKLLERGQNVDAVLHQYPRSINYFPWFSMFSTGKRPPWIEDDGIQFYQALQSRLYVDADKVARTSSLKNWPAYSKLVRSFQELEDSINRPPDVHREEISNSRQPQLMPRSPDIPRPSDFPQEDIQSNDALKILSSLDEWQKELSTQGIRTAWEELNHYSSQFEEWALIGGLKASLSKWQGLFDVMASIRPGNWELPSASELPQPLQNTLLNLSKATKAWNSFAQITSEHWDVNFRELFMDIFKADAELQNWNKTLSKELGIVILRKAHETQLLYGWVANFAKVSQNVWARYQELTKTSHRDTQKDENLLANLTILEMNLTGQNRYGPTWQKEYPKKKFFQLRDPILTNEKHPLYPWYRTARPSFLGGCLSGCGIAASVLIFLIISPFLIKWWRTDGKKPTSTLIPTEVPAFTEMPPISTMTGESPTLWPLPPTSEIPTLEPTPESISLEEPCSDFAQLAANGDWLAYDQELRSNEGRYRELQQLCNWSYSYQQHLLETNLLELLQKWNDNEVSAERNLGDLHKQYFASTPPFMISDNHLSAYRYAHWLRATLAICHLPKHLNIAEASVLNEYLSLHLERFAQARDILLRACGWSDDELDDLRAELDSTRTEVTDISLLGVKGWLPVRGSQTGGCVALDTNNNARWWLTPDQRMCPLPKLSQEMPSWEDTNALTIEFCIVESPQTLPFTLWLRQRGADLGLRFNLKDNVLTDLATMLRLPNTIADIEVQLMPIDSLPRDIGELQIKCEPSYTEMITVQPVWVGDLLFWRILGTGDKAAGEPLLIPVVANTWPAGFADQPVELYWDSDADIQTNLHLIMPVLDLMKTKE